MREAVGLANRVSELRWKRSVYSRLRQCSVCATTLILPGMSCVKTSSMSYTSSTNEMSAPFSLSNGEELASFETQRSAVTESLVTRRNGAHRLSLARTAKATEYGSLVESPICVLKQAPLDSMGRERR